MTIATWLALGEVVWVIGLGTWIILERRSPAATLAWVFALAWIPLLGIPVYLLIGPRRLRRKKLRYRRSKSRLAEASHALRDRPEETRPEMGSGCRTDLLFYWLSEPASRRRCGRSGSTLYSCGDDCYRAIELAIVEAKHHVHLEYYIWEPDRVGTRFRDLLCERPEAASRCDFSSTPSARHGSGGVSFALCVKRASRSPGSIPLPWPGFAPTW